VCVGTVSTMLTFCAGAFPLFVYVNVYSIMRLPTNVITGALTVLLKSIDANCATTAIVATGVGFGAIVK